MRNDLNMLMDKPKLCDNCCKRRYCKKAWPASKCEEWIPDYKCIKDMERK